MKIMNMVFHPNMKQSRVNRTWKEKFSNNKKFNMVRDMYKEYPDYSIDIEREQKLLLEHDRIVMQFPFYWYSCPPLMKKWIDDVLTYGFAYGSNGNALKGKDLQLIISTGGSEESYQHGGDNNFTMLELLRPIEQTANLIGMKYLPIMCMNGVISRTDDEIIEYANKFIERIDK